MIDGHTHLEKGPLSKEYVLEFVKEAINKGIDDLQVLDHSHRFKEFEPMYKSMKTIDSQTDWLNHDFRNSLSEYLDLIREVKELSLPIKVSFGLEVCYRRKDEEFLRDLLKNYHFDFLVGSVHSLFDIAYDSSWSVEYLWNKYSTDLIYKEYFKESYSLIESNLFSQIGHPDTIKMFNYYPSFDATPYYDKLAKLANIHNVKIENNTGCYYRYNHKDKGLNEKVLKVFKDNNCKMITVSDAHRPEDVGNYIKDIWDITMK